MCYKNIVKFFFWYMYLNFPLPSANKFFLITHFFFTSTRSLLLLQFIFFFFFNLDFISSTCLPPLSLVSFQFSKSQSYLVTFGQSSRRHPKQDSEKRLRHKKAKKKIRGIQSHRHYRDHEEKWKAKQKRDQDTREMHHIVKFVKKLSQVSEKLKEICVFVSGRYPFSSRNPVFLSVQPKHSRYCRYLNRYEMRMFLYRFRHQYEKYRLYWPVQYETAYLI